MHLQRARERARGGCAEWKGGVEEARRQSRGGTNQNGKGNASRNASPTSAFPSFPSSSPHFLRLSTKDRNGCASGPPDLCAALPKRVDVHLVPAREACMLAELFENGLGTRHDEGVAGSQEACIVRHKLFGTAREALHVGSRAEARRAGRGIGTWWEGETGGEPQPFAPLALVTLRNDVKSRPPSKVPHNGLGGPCLVVSIASVPVTTPPPAPAHTVPMQRSVPARHAAKRARQRRRWATQARARATRVGNSPSVADVRKASSVRRASLR